MVRTYPDNPTFQSSVRLSHDPNVEPLFTLSNKTDLEKRALKRQHMLNRQGLTGGLNSEAADNFQTNPRREPTTSFDENNFQSYPHHCCPYSREIIFPETQLPRIYTHRHVDPHYYKPALLCCASAGDQMHGYAPVCDLAHPCAYCWCSLHNFYETVTPAHERAKGTQDTEANSVCSNYPALPVVALEQHVNAARRQQPDYSSTRLLTPTYAKLGLPYSVAQDRLEALDYRGQPVHEAHHCHAIAKKYAGQQNAQGGAMPKCQRCAGRESCASYGGMSTQADFEYAKTASLAQPCRLSGSSNLSEKYSDDKLTKEQYSTELMKQIEERRHAKELEKLKEQEEEARVMQSIEKALKKDQQEVLKEREKKMKRNQTELWSMKKMAKKITRGLENESEWWERQSRTYEPKSPSTPSEPVPALRSPRASEDYQYYGPTSISGRASPLQTGYPTSVDFDELDNTLLERKHRNRQSKTSLWSQWSDEEEKSTKQSQSIKPLMENWQNLQTSIVQQDVAHSKPIKKNVRQEVSKVRRMKKLKEDDKLAKAVANLPILTVTTKDFTAQVDFPDSDFEDNFPWLAETSE